MSGAKGKPVRIVYTSDLHSDATPQNAALLPYLARRAVALRPDVFVIAGDLAESTTAVRQSLEVFRAVPGVRLYLPGNHDLFVEGPPESAPTSRDKYERDLPAAAQAAGFKALGVHAVTVENVAFVSVTGWFDYGFRDPALDVCVTTLQYTAGQWRGVRAFDRGHVFWPRPSPTGAPPGAPPPGAQPCSALGAWATDAEIDADMGGFLDSQLRATAASEHVVAIVHVLPFAALVQRRAFGNVAFHDAYLGSAAIGARLRLEPRLRAVITGHLHRPADLDLDGVRVVARPVGTIRDSFADLDAVAAARLGVLEIG